MILHLTSVQTIYAGSVHQFLGDTAHVKTSSSKTPRSFQWSRLHIIKHYYLKQLPLIIGYMITILQGFHMKFKLKADYMHAEKSCGFWLIINDLGTMFGGFLSTSKTSASAAQDCQIKVVIVISFHIRCVLVRDLHRSIFSC